MHALEVACICFNNIEQELYSTETHKAVGAGADCGYKIMQAQQMLISNMRYKNWPKSTAI